MRVKLQESRYLESKPDVDVENGVIRNVKFLGNESEHGRRYGFKTRREALPLYEGVVVNLNHPEGRKLERRIQDWVGKLENVRAEPDGNYGDLRLRKKHPEYEALIEAATHFWENFGLSHVAYGDDKKCDGFVDVQKIETVLSVDIVTEPATCSNLFESRGRRMTAAAKTRARKRTLKAIVESTGKVEGDAKRFREILMESIEGDSPAVSPDTPAAVAENASADDAVKEGIIAGIMAKLRESDGATVEKVAKTLGLGTKLADIVDGGKPAEKKDPPSDAAPDTAEELKESKDRAARAEAKVLLLESGRKATDVMVNALAATPVKERKALMESWPVSGDAPTKVKPVTSPPLFGDEDEEDDEVDDVEKAFQESVKRADATLAGKRLR